MVSQPCKYVTPGRSRKAEQDIDLVIAHPHAREHRLAERIVWSTDDLKTVARAVVGVRGWHTDRFYAATFDQAPEILRFAGQEGRRAAAAILGGEPVAAIICLPELPASGELREKALAALKARGIDGVLSFRTMLTELLASVKVNQNYERSELLQTLRILKNYKLLREPQLELFARRARRAKPREQA
jgi:hypothetical protein